MKSFARYAVLAWVSVMVLLCGAGGARAQTPAPAAPRAAAQKPDDAPSVGHPFHNFRTSLPTQQQLAVHPLVNL